MNYTRIKTELERRKIRVKRFCEILGVTEQGFYQMLRNQSMKVSTLEKISKFLKVEIYFWFIEDYNMDGKQTALLLTESKINAIENLEELYRIKSELDSFNEKVKRKIHQLQNQES